MTTQRLPERALLYWRIRLLIGCLVPALLGGFLYYTAAKLFSILTLIWMAVFVLLCFVYYPMYHHCYSYSVGGKQIRVSRGVVYSQTDVVYVRNLQYTTLSQTPLQRLMDLATLRLHSRRGGATVLHPIRGSKAAAHTVGKKDGGGVCSRRRPLNGSAPTHCTSSAFCGSICSSCWCR